MLPVDRLHPPVRLNPDTGADVCADLQSDPKATIAKDYLLMMTCRLAINPIEFKSVAGHNPCLHAMLPPGAVNHYMLTIEERAECNDKYWSSIMHPRLILMDKALLAAELAMSKDFGLCTDMDFFNSKSVSTRKSWPDLKMCAAQYEEAMLCNAQDGLSSSVRRRGISSTSADTTSDKTDVDVQSSSIPIT